MQNGNWNKWDIRENDKGPLASILCRQRFSVQVSEVHRDISKGNRKAALFNVTGIRNMACYHGP